MSQKLNAVLNRLCKWRAVFAGWQLGTRSKDDPECQAVRDHREATILLRVEMSALCALLSKRGILRNDEFEAHLIEEAEHLMAAYEKGFPGFVAVDDGMQLEAKVSAETTKGWRP